MALDLNRVLRPSTWDDVIGQDNIKDIIIPAIPDGRFPKFSIFSGPVGVGKSCMAELAAKALICTAEEDRPCGKCPSCLDSDRAIIKYNMAKQLGKKDIVQVLNDIFEYKSFTQKTVFILEEVQVLRKKEEQTPFLEELTKIPEDVHIMMCTTELGSLIKGLRSRAVDFKLTTPTPDECVVFIQRILDKLQVQPMSEQAMRSLAAMSEYTPRSIVKHIELLLQDGRITEESINKFFHTVSNRDYIQLIGKLLNPTDNIQTFMRFLKTFEGDIQYSQLLYGLKDIAMVALIETSLGSKDPSISLHDRKELANAMSYAKEEDFMLLVDRLSKIPYEVYNSEQNVMWELVKLKFTLLGLNPQKIWASNTANSTTQRTESVKKSHAFPATVPKSNEHSIREITAEDIVQMVGNTGAIRKE